MDQPVVPFDVARMFFGEAPSPFYLEIVVRTVIVYGYTLLLLRWIGGRSVAQLSMVEFLLVIALGSAVGDALFYPEVPLLHAMAAITLVVGINKALDVAIARWDRVKAMVDGRPIALIAAGRVICDELGRHDMGLAEVMEMLRTRGVRNLGEVEHAFMEPGGTMSLFRFATPQPGLSIMPPPELAPPEPISDPASAASACCLGCGAVMPGAAMRTGAACPHCGSRDWTLPEPAIPDREAGTR